MSHLRVRVCLFCPLGAALVLAPPDPPQVRGKAGRASPAPSREPAREEGVPAAGAGGAGSRAALSGS
jgi:hypothetical protein